VKAAVIKNNLNHYLMMNNKNKKVSVFEKVDEIVDVVVNEMV
ncbi:9010_t:CDS:1, partial [Racocetra persica]